MPSKVATQSFVFRTENKGTKIAKLVKINFFHILIENILICIKSFINSVNFKKSVDYV
jgi:hypothetical protein